MALATPSVVASSAAAPMSASVGRRSKSDFILCFRVACSLHSVGAVECRVCDCVGDVG